MLWALNTAAVRGNMLLDTKEGIFQRYVAVFMQVAVGSPRQREFQATNARKRHSPDKPEIMFYRSPGDHALLRLNCG